MNIKGTLHKKEEALTMPGGTFRKRLFRVKYADNPQYPEILQMELIQANCSQLDNLNIGDEIDVNFNLKGREWQDPKGEVKCFNTLQAWKVERYGAGPKTEPTPMGQKEEGDDSDLPF